MNVNSSWDISNAVYALCQIHPQCEYDLSPRLKKKKWTKSVRRDIVHSLCRLLLSSSSDVFHLVLNFFRPLIVPLLVECESILDDTSHEEYELFVVRLSALIFEFPVIKHFAEIYNSKCPKLLQRFVKDSVLDEPVRKVQKLERMIVSDVAILEALHRFYLSNVFYYRNVWDWTVLVPLCKSTDNVIASLSQQCLFLLLANPPSAMFSSTQLKEGAVYHRFKSFKDNISIDLSQNLIFPVTDTTIRRKCITDSDFECSFHFNGTFLPKIIVQQTNTLERTAYVCTKRLTALLSEIFDSLCHPVPVLIQGPLSCGKTSVTEYLSQSCNAKVLKVQMSDQIDLKILLGTYHCSHIPGKFIWLAGPLTEAVCKGYWLIMEDFDLSPPDIMAFISLLLESKELRPGGPTETVQMHPSFRLILTRRTDCKRSNPLFDSFMSSLPRFTEINVGAFYREELKEIIENLFPSLKCVTDKLLDTYDYICGSRLNGNINKLDLNRRLGLRDLMKCCTRLNTYENLNSAENIKNAFKDVCDCMLAFISSESDRLSIAQSISPSFLISHADAQVILSDNPIIEISDQHFLCGRVRLARFSDLKHCRLSEKSARPVFAYIGQTRRLLESVAACIQMNEPILLCGETGVGKTSVIQYFAHAMRKKLIVINMNQQSDVTDLLGGYKPLDLTSFAKNLWNKFHALFVDTFSESKNEKFLERLKTCFAEKKWKTLCHAMQHPFKFAVKRCEGNPDLAERWKKFHLETEELSIQISHAALMFDFVEGVLTQAIKNGFWVLLDEINLANPEVLQILCGLLENAHGSITLSGRGDSTPIVRSADFRIFACMNPSTDVGKRDLPIGIRNRFTEFFVSEPSSDEDLLKIVDSYLVLNKNVARSVLEIYKELRDTPNLPCYSLRSLCRVLMYAKDAKSGPIMRSLYEGFCMCFVTPASGNVQAFIHEVITKRLSAVCNLKSIVNTPLKPDGKQGDFVNIEGFWIKLGDSPIVSESDYVFTATVRKHLKALARIVSYRRFPVLIQGETSVGKTSLIHWLAGATGNRLVRINNHEHTDIQEYIGSYYPTEKGNLVFSLGALAVAMQKGDWIVLDELNLAPTDVLEALNRVLDDNRELFIPETQQTIHAHANFMLFATQNPPGSYAGRKTLSRAFRNRFIELNFEQIPIPELEEILNIKCKLPPSYVSKMVSVLAELSNLRASSFIFQGRYGLMTLRDLFKWGDRYSKTKFDHPDWLRFMAESGYLLLCSRVRNENDALVVKKVIEEKFKIRIDEDALFSFESDTSKPFSYILSHELPSQFEHIVWTRQMRRLALLSEMCYFYDEPVLLIGETGCGKTTICQILSHVHSKPIFTINCHMLTETSDFLGSLRPVRNEVEKQNEKLFEWVDGPLIDAMKAGGLFLMDEISLADDSVLERLNSVLDPDRSLLLAEKAGSDKSLLKADSEFRICATMNPGGDFGKKELSAALRNRFTEIWCPSCKTMEEMREIVWNNLCECARTCEIVDAIIGVVNVLYQKHPSVHFTTSTRDIVCWVQFINACVSNEERSMSIEEACFHGAHLVFFDALNKSCLPEKFIEDLSDVLSTTLNFTKDALLFNQTVPDITSDRFGFGPFSINLGSMENNPPFNYTFSEKTSLNLKKILRAMQVNKPILLEGSPGVGKTSIVIALARMTRNDVIRINLSDQTDICDLFGTDLPVENGVPGEFEWKDGPLLLALKHGYWILLDEVNLASQSVLEGLNACFDHRGEIFVAELNRTFKVRATHTKIFATQNPYEEGNGRKGLPKSFINRFTRIFLDALDENDIFSICCSVYPKVSAQTLKQMCEFMTCLKEMSMSGHFASNFSEEFNLRDMFRWCDLLENENPEKSAYLIFVARMRTADDQAKVMFKFSEVFGREVVRPSKRMYLTPHALTVGDVFLRRQAMVPSEWESCIYPTAVHYLELMAQCVKMNWLTILVGESGLGKLSIIRILASLVGQKLSIIPMSSIADTSDLLGSFEQVNLNSKLCSEFNKLASNLKRYVNTKLENVNELSHSSWSMTAAVCQCVYFLDSDNEAESKLQEIISLLNLSTDEELSSVLKMSLSKICEMKASTRKYTGKFAWKDSVLVKAVRNGHWVVLTDANKCSASILDRLNSLMEPGGSLLVTEKGISDGCIPTIKPHANFRAFITMDPVHGEISRAMKNRGVEICFLKEKINADTDILPLIECASPTSLLPEAKSFVTLLKNWDYDVYGNLAKVKDVWFRFSQQALLHVPSKSLVEYCKENFHLEPVISSLVTEPPNEDTFNLHCERIFFRCAQLLNIPEISMSRNIWFLYEMHFDERKIENLIFPLALCFERISISSLNQLAIFLPCDTSSLFPAIRRCIANEILPSEVFGSIKMLSLRLGHIEDISFYPIDLRCFSWNIPEILHLTEEHRAAIDRYLIFVRWKCQLLIKKFLLDKRKQRPKFSTLHELLYNFVTIMVPRIDELIQNLSEEWNPVEIHLSLERFYRLIDSINSKASFEKMHSIWTEIKNDFLTAVCCNCKNSNFLNDCIDTVRRIDNLLFCERLGEIERYTNFKNLFFPCKGFENEVAALRFKTSCDIERLFFVPRNHFDLRLSVHALNVPGFGAGIKKLLRSSSVESFMSINDLLTTMKQTVNTQNDVKDYSRIANICIFLYRKLFEFTGMTLNDLHQFESDEEKYVSHLYDNNSTIMGYFLRRLDCIHHCYMEDYNGSNSVHFSYFDGTYSLFVASIIGKTPSLGCSYIRSSEHTCLKKNLMIAAKILPLDIPKVHLNKLYEDMMQKISLCINNQLIEEFGNAPNIDQSDGGTISDETKAVFIITYGTYSCFRLVYPCVVDPVIRAQVSLKFLDANVANIKKDLSFRGSVQLKETGNADNFYHPWMNDLILQLQNLETSRNKLGEEIFYRRSSDKFKNFIEQLKNFVHTIFTWEKIQNMMAELKSHSSRAVFMYHTWLYSVEQFLFQLSDRYFVYNDIIEPFAYAVVAVLTGLEHFCHCCYGSKMDDANCLRGIGCWPKTAASYDLLMSVEQCLKEPLIENLDLSKLLLLNIWALNEKSKFGISNSDCAFFKYLAEQLNWTLKEWLQMKEHEEIVEKENAAYFKYISVDPSANTDESKLDDLFPTYANEFDYSEDQSMDVKVCMKGECNKNVLSFDYIYSLFFVCVNLLYPASSREPVKINVAEISFQLIHSILKEHASSFDFLINGQIVGSLLLKASPKTEFSAHYNFYTDSNFVEVKRCLQPLRDLEKHVQENLLPIAENHPTLKEILEIIKRVLSFPYDSPIAKFLCGLDLILEKCQLWETVAPKMYSLTKYISEISSLVISWRNLEVKCWRATLHYYEIEMMKKTIFNYWFHVYNVLLEMKFLDIPLKNELEDAVRKRIDILKQFLLGSSLIEFPIRMKILRISFALLKRIETDEQDRNDLWRVYVSNLLSYFAFFDEHVWKISADLKAPIEQQLEETVKIARWSEMNYFSLRESSMKNKRAVLKHLHKYKEVFSQPVLSFFVKPKIDLDSFTTLWEHDSFFKYGFTLTDIQCEGNALLTKATQLVSDLMKETKILESSREFDGLYDLTKSAMSLLDRSLTFEKEETDDNKMKMSKELITQRRNAISHLLKALKSMGLAGQRKVNDYMQVGVCDPSECVPHIDYKVKELWRECEQSFWFSWIKREELLMLKPHEDISAPLYSALMNAVENFMSVMINQRNSLNNTFRILTNVAFVLSTQGDIISGHVIDQDITRKHITEVMCLIVDTILFMDQVGELDLELESSDSCRENLLAARDCFADQLSYPFLCFDDMIELSRHTEVWAKINHLLVAVNEKCGSWQFIVEPMNELNDRAYKLLQKTEDLKNESKITVLSNGECRFDEQVFHSVLLKIQNIILWTQRSDQLMLEKIFPPLDDIKELQEISHHHVLQHKSFNALNLIIILYSTLLCRSLYTYRNSTRLLCSLYILFTSLIQQGFRSGISENDIESGEGAFNLCAESGIGMDENEVGMKDVSDQIEFEDQVEGLKNDEAGENNEADVPNEENGIEMSEDINANLQDDAEKNDEQDDESREAEDNSVEEQMGKVDCADEEKLDEKIWGDESKTDEGLKNSEEPVDSKNSKNHRDLCPCENANDMNNLGSDGDENDVTPEQEIEHDEMNEAEENEFSLPDDLNLDGSDDENENDESVNEATNFESDEDTPENDAHSEDNNDGDIDMNMDNTCMDDTDFNQEFNENVSGDELDDHHLDEDMLETECSQDNKFDMKQNEPHGSQGAGGGVIDPAEGNETNPPKDNSETESDKQAKEENSNNTEPINIKSVRGSNTMEGKQLTNSTEFEISNADALSATKADDSMVNGQVASVNYNADDSERPVDNSTLYEQITTDKGLHTMGMIKNEVRDGPCDTNEPDKLDNVTERRAVLERVENSKEYEMNTDAVVTEIEKSEENDAEMSQNQFIDTQTVTSDPNCSFINLENLSACLQSDMSFDSTKAVEVTCETISVDHEMRMKWQQVIAATSSFSHQLCERLRMILEPTRSARFMGDYRTGRRLNMKRVVSYVASEFRKDRIWLRRTKPSERDYQILFAVDNSSSMTPVMNLVPEAVATISRAFQLLNIGKFGIISFGSCSRLLHPLQNSFVDDVGAAVISSLNFSDQKTNFLEMLEYANATFASAPDSRQRLLLILSDGFLNVSHEYMSEHVQKLVNSGVFVALIILDNANQSVFTMKRAVKENGKMKVKPFLADFPFPFYLVIRDVKQLPQTLSDALCQWFEFLTFTMK